MKSKLELKPYHKSNEVCSECGQHTTGITYVEVQGLYDGALYLECQHCDTRWHRFPEGHYLHAKVERWVNGK